MKNFWIIDGKTPETGAQPVEVSSNAAKLALTGLSPGDMAIITGEADRVELYLGSGESSDSNWLVLVNTVEVTFESEGSEFTEVVVDGTSFSGGDFVNLGWYRVGSLLPVTDDSLGLFEGDSYVESVVNGATKIYVDYFGNAAPPDSGFWSDFFKKTSSADPLGTPAIHIPHFLPDRCRLNILSEGT